MTPLEHYQQDLERPDFFSDPAQARAVEALDALYQRLMTRPRRGLFGRGKRVTERGLYMWGGVGRGKTYLMDVFYESLPFADKQRMHFHRFMQYVHREMRARQGEKNPLIGISRDLARKTRVLCFDEFFVTDITDAMILAGLLGALFEQGVTLVATSNIAPDGLYRDGLQRDRFLPAIALLEQRLEVFELAGDLDYRLRALETAGVYYTPHTADIEAQMAQRFRDIAPEPGEGGGAIDIDGRLIPTLRHADGVVWFDFDTLCGGPRATGDYIEIALCHHTIVLSDVPLLDRDASDAARRFINLIDELYDRNVKLIVSAAAAPENLYTGTRLAEPFKRTASRLREMQSHDYLARPHLCD